MSCQILKYLAEMNQKCVSQDAILCNIVTYFQIKTSLWGVLKKLQKSSKLYLKFLIYVLRNVQNCFYSFPQEQDLYHVINYNVQFWYQVTLLRETWHIPLAVEILPLLSKLVTHILSVIHGLKFILLQQPKKSVNILSTAATKPILAKISSVWFDHWSFSVLFHKIEDCFAGTSTRKYCLRTLNCSTIHNKTGGKVSHST